ncbi:hypothetical protein PHYSODRAFT_471988 [Phytophthora sojae]|uniref:CAAX prenyl protease 2/Lysostaphin resistance protein A-like domain-containing protein n=1 Tax=Phytophthora sojae (strain P6497) TaxID=1094619 RepID=G4YI86_PHYSP|nr:hypothetical protein PHYSODRAFT_471988 [Phytophthora sojae]EGZ27469.1 hypothetical protein PHYSODRAFT_471988 [Phytophthora sojae]|eukprot:XP_009514744.1 hypothetical protein PHYSODRAFT_471988 [Phytophthora sojae]
MELALVSGVAFLLLLTSSVAGALVRGLLLSVVGTYEGVHVVVQLCEAATFGWGLVAFMSWFFHVPKRDLVRRLTGFGGREGRACAASVLLHSAAAVAVLSWQPPSEEGQMTWAEMLTNLLLAPMKEELFFRGVFALVAINRLQSVKWGASISSILFAVIHLANARHLGAQLSASYLVFQVAWALLVGLFLALELAASGSLVECVVLHMINNLFALGVARNATVDLTQPQVLTSMLASFTIYAVAIAKQLQALGHKTPRDKEL